MNNSNLSELRDVTCHMVSDSVTCYPTQVNTPSLNPSQTGRRPVLDLPTPEGWKAELTYVTCYIPRWFTRPQTVNHPSTNRAQCRLGSRPNYVDRRQRATHYTTPPLSCTVSETQRQQELRTGSLFTLDGEGERQQRRQNDDRKTPAAITQRRRHYFTDNNNNQPPVQL